MEWLYGSNELIFFKATCPHCTYSDRGTILFALQHNMQVVSEGHRPNVRKLNLEAVGPHNGTVIVTVTAFDDWILATWIGKTGPPDSTYRVDWDRVSHASATEWSSSQTCGKGFSSCSGTTSYAQQEDSNLIPFCRQGDPDPAKADVKDLKEARRPAYGVFRRQALKWLWLISLGAWLGHMNPAQAKEKEASRMCRNYAPITLTLSSALWHVDTTGQLQLTCGLHLWTAWSLDPRVLKVRWHYQENT